MFIPWLKTRRKNIFALSFDLIILIFLYLIDNENLFQFKINFFYISIIWILSSYIYGRYSIEENFSINKVLRKIILNTLLASFITVFFVKILKISMIFSTLDFYTTLILLQIISKLCISSIMLQFIFFISSDLLYKKKKNIILIGDKKITEFDFLPDEIKEIQNINFVTYKNYDEFISSKNNEIHEIIITKDSIQEQEFNFSKKMTIRGIKIYTLLQWIEKTFNRTPCELLSPYEYFKSNYIPLYNFQLRIKRLGDIFLSLILLIILLPINLLLMIFIKLEDGGPIFYSQLRNGFKNKEFKIWKFRSMKIDAENSGPKWADRYDNRITKIGTIIRKMRLDETPQLINVIVGQMSLIGPRPERPEMDKDLNQKINLYSQRYAIRPGLSGWAQVNYPYGASIEDAKNKLSFDLFYMQNFSFFLDLLILFKTVRLVLNLKGSRP